MNHNQANQVLRQVLEIIKSNPKEAEQVQDLNKEIGKATLIFNLKMAKNFVLIQVLKYMPERLILHTKLPKKPRGT